MIWVKLLSLPMKLWSNKISREIRNSLGGTLDIYLSFKFRVHKKVAHVLMEVDTSEGLVDGMEIMVGSFVILQTLDYTNLPLNVHVIMYMAILWKDLYSSF